MNKYKLISFSIFCIILIINPIKIFAVNVLEQKDDFFQITSDTMIFEKKSLFVEFTGNVIAKNQETIIYADTIKIFFYKNKRKEKKIKEITALGHVKYISKNRTAFANKAVYIIKDQTLILTGGPPKITTDENFITGEKITFFIKKNKIIVNSGEKKRVEAFFNSKENIHKKEKNDKTNIKQSNKNI
ncbi:MAG: hypothetical protein B6I26_01495 [Desulfobacteraceae bacterium 4572_130]|nr:MAG: hypothetical protein B6I26_01495 [Desulfobacteraceae bacterium 4572_130]